MTALSVVPATPVAALRQLHLIQWTLRGTLALALLVSMAANVLHAAPDPVARSIAAWSPLALYTAIEVMTRVPIRNRLLRTIRTVATVAIAVIAVIAAVTSYLHMVGVLERYGETWQVVYLLPISVDGLIAVLTLSLLDIAVQVRTITAEPPPPTRRHTDSTAATTAPGGVEVDLDTAAAPDGTTGAPTSKTAVEMLARPVSAARRGGRRSTSHLPDGRAAAHDSVNLASRLEGAVGRSGSSARTRSGSLPAAAGSRETDHAGHLRRRPPRQRTTPTDHQSDTTADRSPRAVRVSHHRRTDWQTRRQGWVMGSCQA
ncbi:DUF2637 domain-containing protein [Dactylosporangium sp. CA-152071]|uniref:DUF2637 domain-containing protein n=1 Tax=Dactylosporangium sp. CA-152071 TaxID=3239933 RepID=UPI003D8AB53B